MAHFSRSAPAPIKQPLVFLPGLLCDERLWRDQAKSLCDVTASVTMDLTLDDSVQSMARRALTAAPEHFCLAALSMGGYVALEILRQAPERVTRLALFDTSAVPDTPTDTAKRLASIEAVQHGRFAGVTPRLLAQLVHPSRVHTEVGRIVRKMAERVGREAFLRQQRAIMGRPDSLSGLKHVHVPTLIGVGDSDVLTPVARALELHKAIKRSVMHVFEHCGHLPALEVPGETSTVLRRWLQA